MSMPGTWLLNATQLVIVNLLIRSKLAINVINVGQRDMSVSKRRGNCYVTSEALYHLLGGKKAGWRAFRMSHEGDTHWFLKHVPSGCIVDATVAQFRKDPCRERAIGTGFLTKRPSKRARELMKRLVWQDLR